MVVKINGIVFEVEHDVAFWNNIGRWEPYSFKILDRFLDMDNVFVDVGAWNGVLSMYASYLCDYVMAFEPDLAAYRKLLYNLSLNDINNIVSHCKACSNSNDKVTSLYIREQGDSVSSLIDRDMDGYRTRDTRLIETVKLSEYLQGVQVGLIKMDIEGGEIYVIDEMREYIKANRPTLFISFHPNWFPDKDKDINNIMAVLRGYNYIYDMSLEQIDAREAIEGLYGSRHRLLFTNKQI